MNELMEWKKAFQFGAERLLTFILFCLFMNLFVKLSLPPPSCPFRQPDQIRKQTTVSRTYHTWAARESI